MASEAWPSLNHLIAINIKKAGTHNCAPALISLERITTYLIAVTPLRFLSQASSLLPTTAGLSLP